MSISYIVNSSNFLYDARTWLIEMKVGTKVNIERQGNCHNLITNEKGIIADFT